MLRTHAVTASEGWAARADIFLGGGLLNRNMCLAFCGMATALSTVIIFLTGIIPFGRTALLVLAGVLLVVVVAELGTKWAWSVYLAVSILSALLAANKEYGSRLCLDFWVATRS